MILSNLSRWASSLLGTISTFFRSSELPLTSPNRSWLRGAKIWTTSALLVLFLALFPSPQAYSQSFPVVTSLTPSEGRLTSGGTIDVTINGSNFTPTGLGVKFGANHASSVAFMNSTEIEATLPNAVSAGVVDVRVTTIVGSSDTAGTGDDFTYRNAPTVVSLSDTEGPLAGGGSLTITGTNFVEGVGYMLGPYITTRLAPELFLGVSASWGRSENEINPLGLYEDSFEAERFLVSGALIGQFAFDQFIIEPQLRLSWFREETEAYSDHYGFNIPDLTTETGALNFGPTFRSTVRVGEDMIIQPHMSLQGIWTFAQDFDASELVDTDEIAEEGLRGRVEVGVNVDKRNALSLDLSGFYDVVANDEFQSWGGGVKINGLF